MSSISGRFLYQFGITAAVAIMVSLLVSFTLTPMMSSRLIRVSDAKGGHDAPTSRGGFYRWIDGTYTHMLAFAMRHRIAVALLALGVVLTSVPLYRAVKQEFIPTNVDEAEFEMSVNGPEGTNLAVMNET
jgi:HAE1 family hydrophobic/amphiphilic exporter-1